MRLMLDTNVLIDYFSGRVPYHEDACRLRVMREFGDAELWVSIQSFADIAYVLRGHAPSGRIQDAFAESLGFLRVCSLDQDDLRRSVNERWEDLEDCLIEQCARKVKAHYLLTRDATGFARSRSIVLTPAEFFTRWETEHKISYASL